MVKLTQLRVWAASRIAPITCVRLCVCVRACALANCLRAPFFLYCFEVRKKAFFEKKMYFFILKTVWNVFFGGRLLSLLFLSCHLFTPPDLSSLPEPLATH
jgi:prolipoprotein diacylglyceryltransferase